MAFCQSDGAKVVNLSDMNKKNAQKREKNLVFRQFLPIFAAEIKQIKAI